MIRAVIFDLYGVLALNGWQAFKTRHFTGRPEAWNEVFELGRQVDAGLAKYAELVSLTAQKSGTAEDEVRYELEHTQANSELLDYIATHLYGKYKLGILSNASNDIVPEIFSRKQQKLFDVVVLSHHVGLTKPDPRMFQVMAERIGCETGECLFVDDQERHAAGAKTTGMQTLIYTDFDRFTTDLQALLTLRET